MNRDALDMFAVAGIYILALTILHLAEALTGGPIPVFLVGVRAPQKPAKAHEGKEHV